MSERTVEEIRSEIDAERQRLNEELTALKSEIRSLGVVVAAGLVCRRARGVAQRVAEGRWDGLEAHQVVRKTEAA